MQLDLFNFNPNKTDYEEITILDISKRLRELIGNEIYINTNNIVVVGQTKGYHYYMFHFSIIEEFESKLRRQLNNNNQNISLKDLMLEYYKDNKRVDDIINVFKKIYKTKIIN